MGEWGGGGPGHAGAIWAQECPGPLSPHSPLLSIPPYEIYYTGAHKNHRSINSNFSIKFLSVFDKIVRIQSHNSTYGWDPGGNLITVRILRHTARNITYASGSKKHRGVTLYNAHVESQSVTLYNTVSQNKEEKNSKTHVEINTGHAALSPPGPAAAVLGLLLAAHAPRNEGLGGGGGRRRGATPPLFLARLLSLLAGGRRPDRQLAAASSTAAAPGRLFHHRVFFRRELRRGGRFELEARPFPAREMRSCRGVGTTSQLAALRLLQKAGGAGARRFFCCGGQAAVFPLGGWRLRQRLLYDSVGGETGLRLQQGGRH